MNKLDKNNLMSISKRLGGSAKRIGKRKEKDRSLVSLSTQFTTITILQVTIFFVFRL